MRLFQTQKTADVYQIINGISIHLGEAPVRKTSCGWMVRIPHRCITSAYSREFRLSFPQRLLKKSRCPCLQIRHNQYIYDVFLSRDIYYLAEGRKKGAAYGNT